MPSMYELTNAAEQLYTLLTDGADEQAIHDTLEAMGASEKLESYAKIIRQFEIDVQNYKDEKNRFAEKQRLAENNIQRMKEAVKGFMQASGQAKAKAGVFDIRLTSGKSCQIVNEELLDPSYFIPQPPKLDKAAVRQALLAGEEVPGATLVQSQGVSIK